MVPTLSPKKLLFVGASLYLSVSCSIIFFRHHYYDDEVFNIQVISQSWSDMLIYLQKSDVHPPLSYILNKLIYELFSSYKAILVFSMFCNISAICYFYNFSENKLKGNDAKILLLIFTFLNGGLLLWTNSMRWYSYWVALFIVLYVYLLKNQYLKPKNIIVIGVILSLMTYISYLTFILLISLFFLFLFVRRYDLTIHNILILSILYIFLCSYQIYIFFDIHLNNNQGQTSSLLSSIFNVAYGIVNGGSVFIANPYFFAFVILIFLVVISGLSNYSQNRPLVITQSLILILVMSLLMIISGIGGKYRNSISLSVPFYFTISYFFSCVKQATFRKICFVSALLLSVVSVINLVTRSNTGKNSYNLPIFELFQLIGNSKNKIIVTYDPTIYFHFSSKNYKTYYVSNVKSRLSIDKGQYVYLIKTYQGSINDDRYEEILQLYKDVSRCFQESNTLDIKKDKYYRIKNILPGDRPQITNPFLVSVQFGLIENQCFPNYDY